MKSPILLFLILATMSISVVAEDAARPNVIIILADDMGYSDLGCYGSEIATPNLDTLAAKGVRFTQFYNAAKCEPTRASLMSGYYWQDAGFGVKRGMTMGEAMKSTGYATFAVGKWHMDGNPVDRGFDRYFGHLSGGSHYFSCNATQRLDDKPFKETPGDDFYMTDANADYAIEFLDEHHQKRPDDPFFIYLSFNAPHSPLHGRPEDIAKYRDTYNVGWDKVREARYKKQLQSGITRKEWRLSPRQDSVPAWDSMREDERAYEATRMAIYAAMVDRMDQAIGRVLDQVREMGDEDNTLVVFLSDNGGSPSDVTTAEQTPEALLRPSGAGKDGYWLGLGWSNATNTPFHSHKIEMGNGGVVTSCIASWPSVIKQPGSITDEPSHIIDLMATLADVGDVPWPKRSGGKVMAKLPGKSLCPLLAGQSRDAHDALYFHLFHNRAIVSDRWKLTTDWDRPWQLFDLDVDRTELTDVSAQNPEVAARLRERWENWYAKVPEKRFTDANGDPQYRRLDDPEESYRRWRGNGDDSFIRFRSEPMDPKRKKNTKNDKKRKSPTRNAATGFDEDNGTIIIEAESTTSPLGQWKKRSALEPYTGSCYLEFMGNEPGVGPADSPLEYRFRIHTPGDYWISLRSHKRLTGADGETARSDMCNDCYLRVEGDYESSSSALPLAWLQNDTKYWGNAAELDWKNWSNKVVGSDHRILTARYKFKAGNEYRLVMSGRAQRFNVDRIVITRRDGQRFNETDPESVRNSP